MPRINYKLKDGTKVSGVTTILKNCGWSADALIGWAYNQGRDGKDRFETSKDAADIGTLVHERIECYLKNNVIGITKKRSFQSLYMRLVFSDKISLANL